MAFRIEQEYPVTDSARIDTDRAAQPPRYRYTYLRDIYDKGAAVPLQRTWSNGEGVSIPLHPAGAPFGHRPAVGAGSVQSNVDTAEVFRITLSFPAGAGVVG